MPTVPFAARPVAPRPELDPVFVAAAVADFHEAGQLITPEPTPAQMEKAKRKLANEMAAEHDPTEGDMYAGAKANTQMADPIARPSR